MRFIFTLLIVASMATGAGAGEADVVKVDVTAQGDGVYSFDVTVLHGDEGWEHYADQWDVTDAGGKVLGTRVLAHPHVGEQPFTRSLGGVEVPAGISRVILRARDKVHGHGGKTITVDLPGRTS